MTNNKLSLDGLKFEATKIEVANNIDITSNKSFFIYIPSPHCPDS